MGRVLVVPVHLDALCLASERLVTEPLVDFTRLPYVDPDDGHDHQAGMPYVSEVLLSTPFEDQGLLLKGGVHLHWALPDTLTRLAEDGSAPLVPNRWLVTRSAAGVVAQQWVVESDFLAEDNPGGVAYPYIAEQMDGPQRLPYRYLGRRMPLAAWQPTTDPSRYLRGLTAMGYGEPTFASFYPHCSSVFGLHDPAWLGVPPTGTSYDVLGWYADAGSDVLPAALGGVTENWPDALRERLAWTVDDDGEPPDRMVCWGRLEFDPQPLAGEGGDRTGVWVGNTATEALAAHLGAVLPSVLPGVDADDLENWLEALAFADVLESASLDVDVKLLEARHADTFRAVPAGQLWSVTDATGDDPDLIALPRDAGDALNALNAAQSAADWARAQLVGLRQELYADWYRYMLCAYPAETSRESYPDPDALLFHLQRKIALINRQEGDADDLDGARDTARDAAAAALPDGYTLQAAPAPQYYLPNEPVVLLTGESASPSDRFGQDGLLSCAVIDGEVPDGGDAAARLWAQARAASLPAAARVWAQPPWHPLLLQWDVDFYPAGRSGNLRPDDRTFGTDFITANYLLPGAAVELSPVAGEPVYAKAANTYTGTTVLSPAARPVMAARILRYLARPVLVALHNTVTEQDYAADPGPALDRYRALEQPDPRIVALIGVYEHLAANETNNLAQALVGFNDALLMRRLTRQLPVADPLGFPEYRAVTEQQVAPAVAGESRLTPQPLSDFNPIRAGAMRLHRLRMVDTFGQIRDIDVSAVGTTSQLRVPAHPRWVALPPRFAQPARLSLRWLDAQTEVAEMNAVPVTSPVCGWLLANHLDGSVAVHTADGAPLGSLYALPDPGDGTALWVSAPGRPRVTVADIANPHLRAVIAGLRDAGPERVAGFVHTLDEALGAIEPEDPDAATQRGHALLVSRPVAVARATVGLELAGRPAQHQDWNVLRQDLRRSSTESDGFTRVRFPIRLGDHGRLGDGLIGYWTEESDGRLAPDFSAVADASPLLTYLDAPTQALTLLVDPRGAVHACCGVLPAKSLRIPAAHYRRALEALEVTFVVAPLVGDAGGEAQPPVPDEPGFLWSWLEHDGDAWTEVGAEALIGRDTVAAAFPSDPDLWATLVAAGWLVPLDDDTALVMPAESRAPLGADPPEGLTALLERPTLAPSRPDTVFPARLVAREGWLTLRPRPTSTAR